MTNRHEDVERVARAICLTRVSNADCLYQHNFEGDWPEDERREYQDPFTGEPRVQLFHRAWRRWEGAARAAIAALSQPSTTREGKTAREYLAEDVWLSIPAYLHKSIIRAIGTALTQSQPSTSVQTDPATFNETDASFKVGVGEGLEMAAKAVDRLVESGVEECLEWVDPLKSAASTIRQLIPQEDEADGR